MIVSGRIACLIVVAITAVCPADELPPIKPIARRIPPMGVELPADVRAKLLKRLGVLEARLKMVAPDRAGRADAAVYLKGVRFAIEIGEFYNLKADVPKAERALATAAKRIEHVVAGTTPWHELRGKTIVLGHVSKIDGSVQPLGITVPAGLDLSKPVPLHIFLHGRGDKITDMHFIDRLEQTKCTWKSDNAIVLEPFGRQCIGWKGPGEVDVFEAIDRVKQLFKIDDNRVALIGFSMGGAGAWHIGAHYADRFAIVCPGAGFAETAEYLRLKPEDYPNAIEQKLWGVNDTPAYVRNLFNTKVVAYSGENDKQKQAADRMARAFKEEGRELHHIIGPGMGHKYHPESLKDLHRLVDDAIKKGRDSNPDRVYLQTRTLRYNRMFDVEMIEMREHWKNATIETEWSNRLLIKGGPPEANRAVLRVNTSNVSRFKVEITVPLESVDVFVDDQKVAIDRHANDPHNRVGFVLSGREWKFYPVWLWASAARKRSRLQGPIDDAFNAPFLIVLPTGDAMDPRTHRWTEFESNRMISRWRALFRGDPRVKEDSEVTEDDIANYHLVLWGDPKSNKLLDRIQRSLAPMEWDRRWVTMRLQRFNAEGIVALMVFPNPLHATKYVVLNSGPTFREAHDRTNSLQNPKLGDWAIVDVRFGPTAEKPGVIIDQGFFDERWRTPLKKK